jgi:hypothetical protein
MFFLIYFALTLPLLPEMQNFKLHLPLDLASSVYSFFGPVG